MKIKRLLFILFVFGIFFSFTNVYADAEPHFIWVGTKKVHEGDTKYIYGGSASLNGGVLTLNNVSVDEVMIDPSDNEHSIYDEEEEFDIKLIGNNKITAICTGSNCTDIEYHGIETNDPSSQNINIIGDGTLNLNVSNYATAFVFSGDLTIGSSINETGPTINVDISSNNNYFGCILDAIKNIYNSNININFNKVLTGLGLWFKDNSEVYNSNITIKGYATSLIRAIIFDKNVMFNDTNILVSLDYDSNTSNKLDNYGLLGDSTTNHIILDDCNVYIKAPALLDSNTLLDLRRSSNGIIDYYFDGTILGNMTFNNITNDMIYTSLTTEDNLLNEYNSLQLNNYKYIHIKNINNYKVLEFNNNINNNTNNLIIKLNGYKIFIDKVFIDEIELDKEDYIYDYNNIFSLTDSGLKKIKELNDGNHKIQFKYINKKIVDVDFTYRSTNINNPETSSNNLIYIYSLFISIIGLLIIIIYKRKVISYEKN